MVPVGLILNCVPAEDERSLISLPDVPVRVRVLDTVVVELAEKTMAELAVVLVRLYKERVPGLVMVVVAVPSRVTVPVPGVKVEDEAVDDQLPARLMLYEDAERTPEYMSRFPLMSRFEARVKVAVPLPPLAYLPLARLATSLAERARL